MAKIPDTLVIKEMQSISTQEAINNAISNKQVMDNVIRLAVEKEQKKLGVEMFTCYKCGRLLSREKFHSSSDKTAVTGVARVCVDCVKEIANNYGEGETAESIYEALRYLDYPWIQQVYQAALSDYEANSRHNTLIGSYITRLKVKYPELLLTFKDSEIFNNTNVATLGNEDELMAEEYKYNRKDVIRLTGYDPFANYPLEADKPLLYAQLINFIDEETKNDGMKLNAVIQIVKKLNQAEKINDQIDFYVNDVKNAAKNMSLIDRMSAASQKLMSVANDLAKNNGVAVNYNNNKSAGASTLSGKIKKLNEIGLRSAKINSFDIGSCEGMRQVAEISEAARHKRIGYDENVALEIKDIKVELVEQLTKERDEAKELMRKVLLENKDLKDFLKEKGLIDDRNQVIDDA